MATPRWARGSAILLRPVAITVGATFAVHRLSLRLHNALQPGPEVPDSSGWEPLGPYPERLVEAMDPSRPVLEAASRTAGLAAGGIVAGLVLGWLTTWIMTRVRRGRRGANVDRPISDRSTGLILAIAVPGLAWLPIHRLAVDGALIPGDASAPIDTTPENLASYGLWAILIGVALAPTVAAGLTGGRPWSSEGAGGHVALGALASRPSSDQRWRIGLPTATLATVLVVAEVAASTGGLFDRFIAALAEDRPDQLLPLATPLIVAGAVLVPLADAGSAVLRRLEKPRVPGSDRVRPGKGPALTAIVAVVIVGAAAVAGFLAGPDPDPVGSALSGPRADAWLGTDEVGRSVAARTGAALAATLAASAIPAVAATAVGAGLAFVRRTRRATAQAGFDILLDLASWPGVLVVPVAAWSVAGSPRSLLDPVVLQITGLLLVPTATRLLVGPARGTKRVARLGAVACVVTLTALAIQLVAGFVVPAGDDGWIGLGQLAATGISSFAESPLPLLAAAGAAIGAATALAWSAGALTRVGRAKPRPLPEAEDGWSAEQPDGALLAPAGSGEEPGQATGIAEPAPVSVTLEDWPQVIELDADRTEEVGAETNPEDVDPETDSDDAEYDGVASSLDHDVRDELDEDVRGDEDVVMTEDIREQITVPVAVDQVSPDELRSIEEEASQTIELRPADLRRAGVEPDQGA